MDRSVADANARVGALLDAWMSAVRDGRAPEREAFLAAHAEVAEELRAALIGLDFVAAAQGALAADVAEAEPEELRGTLGDFRLLREVGRGGMGVVYEAEQVSLGRRVALKVLPFASVLDGRQLQRFRHEAQAAALLHHTNIVPVYSVGTERGVHYYAMQFVEGRTLAQVIAELRAARKRAASATRARSRRPSPREKPPRQESTQDETPSSAEAQSLAPEGTTETPQYCRAVASLGAQAADALDHAHENGVVHRDVKPANLMLDARGHVWVTDFGLATSRVNTNLTLTGAIVGTLGYMSPEQALGKRVPLDHRTDVYSLGVTLLEALTLEAVFPGEDPRQVIQDIAWRAPKPPRRANAAVPPALETILLKAAAKDPETRYGSAREMSEDLRRFLDDKPVLARRPPLLDRATLWARRHRAAVAAAAAVLVVAVVALAVSTVTIAAEKKRVEEANEKTKAALDESTKNAARAEANFGKALDAVDRMLTRAGHEHLVGVPGFEPIRRKLLEDSVAFYRGFLDAQAGDPRVRVESARAYAQLARLHTDLADFPAAQVSIDRAEAMFEELAPKDGSWSQVLHDLVHGRMIETRILISAWRKADAIAVMETAVTLAERNARERPDDPHFGPCLANVHRVLAGQLLDLGLLEKAERSLAVAAALQAAAFARSPNDADVREGLARIETMTADLAFESGRSVDGEAALTTALSHCEAAASSPADSSGFDLRADVLHALGEKLTDLGRLEEAEGFLRQAVAARKRQTSEFPRFPDFADGAADSCAALAAVLDRLGRTEEAKAALADAIGRYERFLVEFGEIAELRETTAASYRQLGGLLGDSGRHAEARSAYQRSVGLYRAHVAAAPEDLVRQERLAEALGAFGTLERLPSAEVVGALEEAVKLLDAAVERSPSIPRCRDKLANALNALAVELANAGDVTGSLGASERCVATYRRLSSDLPNSIAFRKSLGMSLGNRGEDLRTEGRLAEAEAALDESISILDGLVPALQGDVELPMALGVALNNRGVLEKDRGRLEQAESLHRRSLDVRERLCERFPRIPLHRRYLGASLVNLCGTLRLMDRAADAEPYIVRTIELYRGFAQEDAADAKSRRFLRHALFWLAGDFVGADRRAEAEPLMREKVRVCGEMAEAAPTLENRMYWVQARQDLAEFIRVQGGAEEAERGFRELVELAALWEAEDPAVYRRVRMSTLWAFGIHYTLSRREREARDVYLRMIEHDPTHYNAYHNLVLTLGDDDDPALRDRARAVELARTATTLPHEKHEAWSLLGYALVCNGEWSDGIAAFATANERNGAPMTDDDYGENLIYVALAHGRLGDLAQANDWFRRAAAWIAELDPEVLSRAKILRRRDEVAALLGIPVER